MNLIAFPVGTTNLFPAANTVTGGQLMTEFNLRSRESVETPSSIKYIVGPSFAHSMDDFALSGQQDNMGVTISNSVLQISPGRAVVNGHYLESLVPINIDMTEVNTRLLKSGRTALTGDLAIGIRMMYSTEKTIAGSIKVENEDDYFEGVHIVILPKADMKLPVDVPEDESKVTAHLLLGTFKFMNGSVAGITQNADKVKYIDGNRISNVEDSTSSNFLTIPPLDPSKLYSLAGAGVDKKGNKIKTPTWQNSTGALMKWDSDHTKPEVLKPGHEFTDEAYFYYNQSDDKVQLVVPHLVNGKTYLYNTSGQKVYYPDKILDLPSADFSKRTGGAITKRYTDRIRTIDDKINDFYHVLGGRCLAAIDVLTDRALLPLLPTYANHIDHYLDDETIDGRLTAVEAATRALDNYNKQLQSLVLGWVAESTELAAINSALDVNTSQHNEFIQKHQEIDDQIQSLKEEIESLKGDSTGGGSSEPVHDWTSVNNIPKKVDGATSDNLTNLQSSLKTLIKELQDAVDADYQHFKDQESAINSTLGVHGVTINNLVSTTSQHTTAINNIRIKVDTLEESIDSIVEERVDAAETELEEKFEAKVDEWVDTIQTQLDEGLAAIVEEYRLGRAEIHVGDYIIVRQDMTVEVGESGRYPSTMYVVLPGECSSIKYGYHVDVTHCDGKNREAAIKMHKRLLPNEFKYIGVLLNEVEVDKNGTQFTPPADTELGMVAPQSVFNLLEADSYGGVPGKDYFAVRVCEYDEDGSINTIESYLYTPNTTAEPSKWSEPYWLTGEIQLATEDAVGGFLNVDSTALGSGYVARDDTGHLRLLDYELLASGVLAYNLGHDFQTSSGLGYEEVQSELDNYVNYRVAFPNIMHLESTSDPLQQRTINVTVDISEWDADVASANIITLGNIDSRFGTAVHVHLVGKGNSSTTVDLVDIEKLKLDISSLEGDVKINLRNCSLCYDAYVLDRLSYIEGLSLWYEKYEEDDPNLIVDDRTVELDGDVPAARASSDEEYWSEDARGDFYYRYALKSITLGSDGTIIRMGIYISDDTTVDKADDQVEGTRVFVSSFKPPQSTSLPYPTTLFKKQIKVSGEFVTSYPIENPKGYVVKDNTFSILTGGYDEYTATRTAGMISIFTRYMFVNNAIVTMEGKDLSDDIPVIDSWKSGEYHIFYGGII